MTQNTGLQTTPSAHHPPAHHHHHHRRTQSSNASKVRPARPTLHRRGTTTHSIHKLGSGQPRPAKDVGDEFDMAASFLNFCAMCERQITVPDNSLLYCSENCRRKDSRKPLSASCPSTTPIMSSSSTTTPPSSPPMSPRMIVAPLTPTRLPTKSSVPIRIPSGHGHDHDHHDNDDADLDSSEWKPIINSSAPSRFTTLASSSAWTYLSQFHDEPMLPVRRPGSAKSAKRGSTTSLSAFSAPGTLPALANTPSTMASSFSSSASDASLPLPLQDAGATSVSMSASQNRPLPPRHKSTNKSVELVVPFANAPVVDVTAPESDRGSIFPASSSLWGS